MSQPWIKMLTGLRRHPKVVRMASALDVSKVEAFAILYDVAEWFELAGRYGKIKAEPETLDYYLERDGVAAALVDVGWLRVNDGVMTVHGFCTVSATRKSIGSALRAEVLAEGKCRACGATEDLVIGHIMPIALGGSCERENLQCLCRPCNCDKADKHPDDWKGRDHGR